MATAGPERFCGSCGATVRLDDEFCPSCGVTTTAGGQDATVPRQTRILTGARQAVRSRKVWAVGAALAVVLVALAVFLTRDDSAERASATLVASQRIVMQPATQLANANTLAQLQEAGQAAAEADRQLSAQTADARAISDSDIRDPVSTLVSAERAVVAQLASLATVKPSSISEGQRSLTSARESLEQLTREIPRAQALDLDAVKAAIPDVAKYEASIDHALLALTAIDRKLVSWRKRLAAMRSKQRSDLADLRAYEGTMTAHFASYDALRTAMQNWVDKVDSSTSTTFEEAYDFLGGASASRAQLRDALRLQASPKTVRAAHNRIIQIMSDAVAAVDAAYTGLSDYQYDQEAYDDYSSAPGWREFEASSPRLAGEYSSARAAWTSAIRKAKKAIKDRQEPDLPDV